MRRVVVVAALLSVTACARDLVFVMLDPGEKFDPSSTPPAPDYASASSWAALPTTVDDADVALPVSPAIDQTSASVDVFYLHPTTWLGRQWNAETNTDDVATATARGGTLIQASAFNACCAVYAPRYRQASGQAFTEPSDDGARAVDVAYGDVLRAFEYFVTNYSRDRPFIIAGHSQGSFHGARLLKERVLGTDEENRLVVAYLIGSSVGEHHFGESLPACDDEKETKCVVAFNVRGPAFEPNALEFPSPLGRGHHAMAGRMCVNPLSWKSNGPLSPRTNHLGALFLDAEKPRVLSAFSTAECTNGMLLVKEMRPLPERRFVDDALLRVMGEDNYHPIEYQLLYMNLRTNTEVRVNAYLSTTRSGPVL